MAYKVDLKPVAERERRKLSPEIKTRINQELIDLEANPRPVGSTKLVGSKDRWRIRVGDYRIIYTIDDTAQQLTIMRISHRRDVYR